MIAAAIIGAAGITVTHAADDLPPMDAPVAAGPPIVEERPAYDDGAYRAGGPYAAIPREPLARPGIQRPAVPPSQVAALMRSFGYAPLGRISRRGEVYSVAALNRYGDDGRLLVDARTGRIMRFVPAMAVDDDFDDVISQRYVPPPFFSSRRLRPPLGIPRVASRPPVPATVATSRPKAPPSAQQQAAVKPPNAAVSTAPATAEAKPSVPPSLLPTGALPPVQPLE